MDELGAILETWRAAGEEGSPAVLATVVHVRGSAYRRPGARMLILPDGRRIGTISGGCLEGEVSKKAWWMTSSGAPTLRTYDTSAGEDAVWEFGLGCNGVVEVLLERLDGGDAVASLEFLDRCRCSRREAVVACVILGDSGGAYHPGDRLFLDDQGMSEGRLVGTPLEPLLREQAEGAFRERRSRLVHFGECRVFVEWVAPPQSLVLFGAGHDAVPLVAIASELGWQVTVADGRPAYLQASRFPGADRVVLTRPGDWLAGVEIGPQTAVVLMTHNYELDRRLLRELLPRRPRYLGLLGPKNRAERLLAELGAEAAETDLHAPVGLDIGATTPASIAVAVVAEIQAALTGRPGGRLRLRSGPMHAPEKEVVLAA